MSRCKKCGARNAYLWSLGSRWFLCVRCWTTRQPHHQR